MTSPLVLLALLAPLALALAAIAGHRRPGVRPIAVASWGRLATMLGVAVAAVAAGATAITGTVSSPTLGLAGLGLAVRLDGVSIVMFAMVALLAVVIYRYSATYLEGDRRHGLFLGRLAATLAAVELLVLSGNLAQLFVAWVLTSLALHGLLLFYPDRPRARVAARKKFVAARTADLFLLLAIVILYRNTGTGDFGAIFSMVGEELARPGAPLALTVAAVALSVAALLKAAQFPTHSWLVEIMETPTPVSALLHAGILNAGPFLIIRMAAVVDGAGAATSTLIVVGGVTAVFASVALLTQPSVKVALGYSSVAHMGFMLMVCGIGVYPAALLHLVAHSFYKAHAFLSSGSVVDEARAAAVAVPRRLGRPSRLVLSALVAATIYGSVAWLWHVDFGAHPMVLVMGSLLVLGTTQLVAPALDSTGRVLDTIRVAAMALGVTLSFFVLEAGAHQLVQSVVPDAVNRGAGQLALAGTLVAVMAVVIVLQVLEPARPSSDRRRAIAVHVRNGLYANALFDRAVGALRLPARRAAEVGP